MSSTAGTVHLVVEQGRVLVAYARNRFPLSITSRAALADEPEARGGEALEAAAAALNADKARLHALLEAQHYRLTWWRLARDESPYRRFFDVNGLIGVRVEDRVVFDAMHKLVVEWIADGSVDGLRIDHVDGLADPAQLPAAAARARAGRVDRRREDPRRRRGAARLARGRHHRLRDGRAPHAAPHRARGRGAADAALSPLRRRLRHLRRGRGGRAPRGAGALARGRRQARRAGALPDVPGRPLPARLLAARRLDPGARAGRGVARLSHLRDRGRAVTEPTPSGSPPCGGACAPGARTFPDRWSIWSRTSSPPAATGRAASTSSAGSSSSRRRPRRRAARTPRPIATCATWR